MTINLENPTVTISVEEYNELLDEKAFLDILRACGVNNWDGYSDAHEMYREIQNQT